MKCLSVRIIKGEVTVCEDYKSCNDYLWIIKGEVSVYEDYRR